MKRSRKFLIAAVLSFAMAAYSFGTLATAAEEAVISADDHSALAAHFESEAKKAREGAAMHRMMAESYRKMGGPAISKWQLDKHCDKLVASYEAAAKDLESMAQAHRDLAGKK